MSIGYNDESIRCYDEYDGYNERYNKKCRALNGYKRSRNITKYTQKKRDKKKNKKNRHTFIKQIECKSPSNDVYIMFNKDHLNDIYNMISIIQSDDEQAVNQNDNNLIKMEASPLMIYSMQQLIKWVRNSDEGKFIHLNFSKICDDLKKNVVGNKESIKLFYQNGTNYAKLNSKLWAGNNSIIQYILDDFYLFPADCEYEESKAECIEILSKMNKLSQIIKQSALILRLLLIETKLIDFDVFYIESYPLYIHNLYDHIRFTVIRMFVHKEYFKKYDMEFILTVYLDLFVDIVDILDKPMDQRAVINLIYDDHETPTKDHGWSFKTIFNRQTNSDMIVGGKKPTFWEQSLCFLEFENLLKQLLLKDFPICQFVLKRNGKIEQCLDLNEVMENHPYILNKYQRDCLMIDTVDLYTKQYEQKEWDKILTLKERLSLTVPLFLVQYMNEIKTEKICILKDCLFGIMSDYLVHIVVDYLYYDLNVLYGNHTNKRNLKIYHCFHSMKEYNEEKINGLERAIMSNYLLDRHKEEIILTMRHIEDLELCIKLIAFYDKVLDRKYIEHLVLFMIKMCLHFDDKDKNENVKKSLDWIKIVYSNQHQNANDNELKVMASKIKEKLNEFMTALIAICGVHMVSLENLERLMTCSRNRSLQPIFQNMLDKIIN
eukprot:224459_1